MLMAVNKQVLDLRHNSKGITQLESNEQQRNWTKNFLELKAKDSLANYDPSRLNLNFEVARGGKIQPIDTSKSIAQKFAESLERRGIKDPNSRPDVRRRQNTLAQFIFGGSREKMLELAFGNQSIDFQKGADNSHLHREKKIEGWAKDVYDFVAKKFGEDNIVGFYVHLDETNPHIHCSVIPVDEEKNCISWTSRFGSNRSEGAAIIRSLHDQIVEEVNSKYGLERGSDKAETQAKHRSTEEYKRDLVRSVIELSDTVEGLNKQIQTMERKIKSFSTMLQNLQDRKEGIQAEIELLEMQKEKGKTASGELEKKLDALQKQMEEVDAKIDHRQAMLSDTNAQLEEAKVKLAELQEANENTSEEVLESRRRLSTLKKESDSLEQVVADKNEILASHAERDAQIAYNRLVAASYEPLKETLTTSQKQLLEESGYNELTENGPQIIKCALLLGMGYVSAATAFAESCGGGGSPGTGWGRAKDDDDDRWWLKCITMAASMTRSSGRKSNMKR